MGWYHLLIRGDNFLIDFEGRRAKHGFYQNLFVQADSPEAAESRAVERLRSDEALKSITLNAPDDPPILLVEEMAELADSGDLIQEKDSGRVWYRNKRWWQFWK